MRKHLIPAMLIVVSWLLLVSNAFSADPSEPIPSWGDGPARKAILEFVAKVTKEGSG